MIRITEQRKGRGRARIRCDSLPLNSPRPRHFFAANSGQPPPPPGWIVINTECNRQGETWLPDSLLPVVASDAYLGTPARLPALDERFLPPRDFVWGSFAASDGAALRWGHLPVREARAACVIAVGFGEFIEKHFETMRDLAARGIAVWCLDWRGQGRSIRPSRFPTRPRPSCWRTRPGS